MILKESTNAKALFTKENSLEEAEADTETHWDLALLVLAVDVMWGGRPKHKVLGMDGQQHHL